MLQDLNLTARQRAMVADASAGVPAADVDRFEKYLSDVLRGFVEISDHSVSYAIGAGLGRYGRQQ
jgi:hypothetical protein